MQSVIDIPIDIPTVIISNDSEGTIDYLQKARENRDFLIRLRQIHGDRACLWCGDPKLVITSHLVPHLSYLQKTIGYQNTCNCFPQNPSLFLSLDILRESFLLNKVIAYAGEKKILKLIPYTPTLQFFKLVNVLRNQYGLTIVLPESPELDALWLRDYINTKSGFRTLVSQWLAEANLSFPKLPFGMIIHDLETAAKMAYWFVKNDRSSIVKVNDGTSGIGQERFDRTLNQSPDFSRSHILKTLQLNPYFQPNVQPNAQSNVQPNVQTDVQIDSQTKVPTHDQASLSSNTFVVEEWIQAQQMLSPSIELFVPPLRQGKPKITYLGNQLFLEPGRCAGILIAKELLTQKWYAPFADASLLIARKFQTMGYVGHFDIDAVVDDQGNLFWLESNPRRTSTTSVHEFAQFHFGPDYLNQVVLLSDDEMESGTIEDFELLLQVIGDLQFPRKPICASISSGVVVTIASFLEIHRFGCLIVAPSVTEVLDLHHELKERILR